MVSFAYYAFVLSLLTMMSIDASISSDYIPQIPLISEPSFSSIVKSDCPDPLSCWLEDLVFQIPDTCFDVEGTDCCITNFVCTGISLSGIDSSYTSPTTLFMELEGLGTPCKGDWSYGRLGGSMEAVITNTDISTTMVTGKDDIYPVSLEFSTCEIPSIDIELSFKGGLVGWLLDLISGKVSDGLEKAIFTVVCEKGEPALAEKVTEALIQTIDPTLQDIVNTGPTTPADFDSNNHIDWSTSLPGLLQNVEEKYSNDLLNKLVDKITNGTGVVDLDLKDATFTFPVVDPTSGPLANISLILHSMELSGLDSFYDISLLVPSPESPSYSPYSIWSTFSMHSLSISLSLTVDIVLDQKAVSGGELTETFTLELDVSHSTLGMDLLFPINTDRLGELFLDQALDLACLISTADELSVTSLVFNTHIDSFTVSQNADEEDSLEQDIDDLINNIIKLGIDGFPELMTGLISGLAQGAIRSSVNEGLAELLINSPLNCVPHSESEEDEFIAWADSTLISGMDYVLNTMLGPSGLNDAVDKLTDGTGSVTIPLSAADISMMLFGLDTFYDFSFLAPSSEPEKMYTLATSLGVGYCEGHGRKDVCTPIGLALLREEETSGLSKLTSALSVDFSNFDFVSSMLAKFNMKTARNLKISDLAITSGTRTGCLLSGFDALAIETLQMSVSDAQIQKGVLVDKDITESVQKVLGAISSPKALDAINGALSKLLGEAATACESGSWPPINTDDDDFPTPTGDCEGPVQCGLNTIVIGPFPDLCIDISNDSIEFCVKAFSCYDIDVTGLESGNPSASTIFVGVDNFAITCSADWSIGGVQSEESLKPLSYEGSFSIAVADFTGSLNADIGSSPAGDYPPLPDSVHISDCQVSGTRINIEFEGGVIGSLLDRIVAPPLEKVLEGAVYWALCDVLDPLLARVVGILLKRKIDPVIEAIIDQAAPPAPVVMPGYVNWNTTLISTLHKILDQVKANKGEVLQCMIGNSDKPVLPGYDLNSLIDHLTDGTGVFDIHIGSSMSSGDASLSVESITISGLDTFEDIFLLDPSAESGVTLSSSVGLKSLDIQVEVMLTSNGDTVYQQTAVVDLLLTNATLAFDMVVALKQSVLNSLYLDQVLNLACIESALDNFYISSLELLMNVDHLTIQQVSGGDATSLEEETADLINSLFTLLLSGFPEMTTDIIAGITQGPIKAKINDKLSALVEKYEETHASSCPTHVNYTSVDWVEWENSPLIEKADNLLNSLLGADGINRFMNCLTDDSGALEIVIPATSPILAGWVITLGGLNSFFDFALVYPLSEEPYDLGNLLGMGSCNSATDCNPFFLALEGDHQDRHIHLEITMDNLKLYLDLLMELDLNALKDLTLAEFHTEGCGMSTVDALGITDLSISTTDVEFFFNDGNGVANLTGLVDTILEKLTSPDMMASINSNFADKLSVSEQVCAGTYDPSLDDGNSSDKNNAWRWELAVLIALCVVFLGGLIWIYFKYGVAGMSKACLADGKGEFYGKEAEIAQLVESPPTGFLSNVWFSALVAKMIGNKDPDYRYDALIAQDRIYPAVRLLIPLALLGNIALFLSANIATGATVKMEIDLGDQVINPPPIFEFGLGNTVRDMWNAGVYPLSILIAFFSGAWPYIKLATMFVSWILPCSVLKLPKRDSLLIWLDILGKWSLIDTYVMVLMMVAFQFTLDLAPGLEVLVIVEPNWGFYAFLLATMCSLGLGHLVLACHRLIAETKIPPQHSEAEAVMNHTFSCEVREPKVSSSFSTNGSMDPENSTKDKFVWKRQLISVTTLGKVVVVIVLLATALAVVAGTFIDTFNFEFKGLTGLLLGNDAVAPYSLVTVGTTLPSASGTPNNFGVRWIQASYFAFGLGMPLAFCGALLFIWTVPLTMKFQKGFIVLTEVFNAWNALDVFVVSIVAALLEIQQFAKFLVGDSCDTIDKYLKEYLDDQLDGDDKCFDVVATLKSDAWMLYVAAGCLVIVGLPMMAMAHSVVGDRMDKYQRDKAGNSRFSIDEPHGGRSTSMSASGTAPKLFATAAERDAVIASIDSSSSHDRNALLAGVLGGDEAVMESREHRVLTIDLAEVDTHQQSNSLSNGTCGNRESSTHGSRKSANSLGLGAQEDEEGESENFKHTYSQLFTSMAVNTFHSMGMVRFHQEQEL